VKQFIVLSAVLPLLMIFVMQTAYDQKNNHAISKIHDMVYVAKEQAKEESSFTQEIQERLRKNLSNYLGLPPGEISIFCREEDDLLFYRVEVPIKDVMAGGKLLGIKDKDNQYTYVIDSYTKARVIPEIIDDVEDEGFDDIE
jgi:hypothetical protein